MSEILINRRNLFAGAAASLVLFRSYKARAGTVTDVLDYLQGEYPFLGIVAIIEAAITPSDGQTAELDSIADKIHEIASNQDTILEKLAEQRIVMREEINHDDFINDVAELASAAYNFKIALTYAPDVRDQSLRAAVGAINRRTFKLSTTGLAGLSAYIAAISLQNSVHYVINSPLEVFRAVNDRHRSNLKQMLNGNGPDSIDYFIDHAGYDSRGVDVLGTTEKTIPIGEFVKSRLIGTYDMDHLHVIVDAFGMLYKGVNESEPVFEFYVDQKLDVLRRVADSRYQLFTSTDIMYPYANSIYSDDYKRIPALRGNKEVYFPSGPDTYDEDYTDHFQFNGKLKNIIQSEIEGVHEYYAEFVAKKKEAEATADQIRDLIKKSIKGLDNIMSARARLAIRPGSQIPKPSLDNR